MLPETFARESWQDSVLLFDTERDDVLLMLGRQLYLRISLFQEKQIISTVSVEEAETETKTSRSSLKYIYIFLQYFLPNIKMELVEVTV